MNHAICDRRFEAGHLQFITTSTYRRARLFSHPARGGDDIALYVVGAPFSGHAPRGT
jgi:hypothetical protein